MIEGYSPAWQAFLGTLFTWGVTALGSAVVFVTACLRLSFAQERLLLDGSLGFAAGVMIAASYWSLLAPAIEFAEADPTYGPEGKYAWFPAAVGFLMGGAAMQVIQALIPDVSVGESTKENARSWKRIVMLIIAITVHNFPEGMAVGVAFGAIGRTEGATFQKAVMLTIGIGIQNFPEGLAVSMPLRREGASYFRSFWYGQLSGIVEPVGGLLGAGLVLLVQPILPYALSFAAGAMIFVVCDDLIPEAHEGGNKRVATTGTMIGFAVMMALDVGLG